MPVGRAPYPWEPGYRSYLDPTSNARAIAARESTAVEALASAHRAAGLPMQAAGLNIPGAVPPAPPSFRPRPGLDINLDASEPRTPTPPVAPPPIGDEELAQVPAPPRVYMDTETGTSGGQWARERAAPPPDFTVSPELASGVLFSGDGTQADLEGRFRVKQLLDAIYGTDQENAPLSNAQQVARDAEERLAAARAQQEAADPLGYATAKATAPYRAQRAAQQAQGADILRRTEGFSQQLAGIQARREALRANPKWAQADEATRAAAEAPLDDAEEQLNRHIKLWQQAWGMAGGHTPSQLYADR